MHKLPVGLQNFQVLRTGGYLYVDKTALLHRLVTEGKYYFLSRPRRFGKSLMVSTLAELFQGSSGAIHRTVDRRPVGLDPDQSRDPPEPEQYGL